jgi:DNA ligase (NAD+)
LSFVVWDIIEDTEDFSNSKDINLQHANDFGFNVVPRLKIIYNNEDFINTTLQAIKHLAELQSLPMDGVVCSYDNIEYGKTLGKTSHHFNHSVAYKFEDDCAETTLRAVEWTMGKVGSLCPTAVFDTVQLEGTEVNRASLHNVSICKSLEIGIGDTITVKKCNQIIPQLQDNLTRSNTLEIPTQCPICGGDTKIIKENESEVLMCTNPDCNGKLLGKLTHFVSKNAANINGLSEQTLQKFIDLGWLTNFKDIYHLSDHKTQMYNLEGFGRKSVDKLLENIEKSRNIDLAHFIYSLSIPLIGKTASKGIAKLCNDDFQTFVNNISLEAGRPFVMNIDGFGKEMKTSIRWWWNENNEMCLNFSKEFNFKKKKNNSESDKKVDLIGKTFVITGSLTHYKNRNELVEIIESFGGKVSGSVSTKTNFLLNNDIESNSSKNRKAKELGISIITEEDFINMIS